MKSLLITLITVLFLVVCFDTMIASSDGNSVGTTNTGNGQYSWEPETIWCQDLFDVNYRMVTQCDNAGGACSDQYCPCSGRVIDL